MEHEARHASSAPAPATFRADHPFVYLIRDKVAQVAQRTGSILFLGVGHHGCHRYLTARRSNPETPKSKIIRRDPQQ